MRHYPLAECASQERARPARQAVGSARAFNLASTASSAEWNVSCPLILRKSAARSPARAASSQRALSQARPPLQHQPVLPWRWPTRMHGCVQSWRPCALLPLLGEQAVLQPHLAPDDLAAPPALRAQEWGLRGLPLPDRLQAQMQG